MPYDAVQCRAGLLILKLGLENDLNVKVLVQFQSLN